jgi:hypothetical protein
MCHFLKVGKKETWIWVVIGWLARPWEYRQRRLASTSARSLSALLLCVSSLICSHAVVWSVKFESSSYLFNETSQYGLIKILRKRRKSFRINRESIWTEQLTLQRKSIWIKVVKENLPLTAMSRRVGRH